MKLKNDMLKTKLHRRLKFTKDDKVEKMIYFIHKGKEITIFKKIYDEYKKEESINIIVSKEVAEKFLKPEFIDI